MNSAKSTRRSRLFARTGSPTWRLHTGRPWLSPSSRSLPRTTVHPIGASGMLRFGEAALQVHGAAGEHQVDGVRRALGHAYVGGSQFFSMWVVGTEKPSR